MKITTQDQLRDNIETQKQSASDCRMRLASKVGVDECYYEGVQWLNQLGPQRWTNSTTGRLYTNWSPDSNALRVTMNEVTEKIILAAAATHPSSLDASVTPPARNAGVEASMYTQVHEDTLAVLAKKSGLLLAAQDSQFRRAICGTFGIALGLDKSKVNVDGQPLTATKIRAFSVHPTRYILDPAITSRNLRDHEEVIYEDVWTLFAIKARFGVTIPEDEAATIGELTPYEQQMSLLSDYRLFQRYWRYSKTKGARVYEVHIKSPTGMWDEYHIAIEVPGKELIWVNRNNPVTPFGGDGLPHVLLHAHRRSAETMWSISDVSMCKDSQDRINLLQTLIMRHLQRFSAPQYKIDSRWFGAMAQKEDFAEQFSNRAGGLIIGKPSADKSIMSPELVNPPPPQPMYTELADRASADMRRNTFRSEMNTGAGTKSHVPYETTKALLQEGDRVLGIRVTEDAIAYTQILSVLLGTGVSLVQQMDAGVLADLDEEEFDEQDLSVLLQSDPRYPTCGIDIAEGNIRYRSANEQRSDLANTLQTQAIGPNQFRQGMAELDSAVTPQDRHMQREIDKAVTMTLMGQDWQVLPLGEYGEWAVQSLRRALFDRRAKRDPMVRQKIAEAIQMQTQANVQEALASNPEVALAQMQAEQQAAAAQPAPAQPEMPPPATVGEAMDRMMGAGG